MPAYKVLLVGDANVGKSSLIRRMVLGEFDPDYTATVGVDLSAIAINVDPITPVILTAIDLGGQEDFSRLRTLYYQGAHFAMMVYDITNQASFTNIPDWIEGLMINVSLRDGKNFPCMLVANKVDKEGDRVVQSAEGRILADSRGWPFYEASAKTGKNVEEMFLRIAKHLYSSYPPVRL
ncbi:MAG: Rab family GTPase [Candidatus Thorarchaeota archaeon]